MKKIFNRIVMLTIMLIFVVSIKSFAESSFNFYIKNGVKVNPGQTVEIPIIIDTIKIEGVEKKLISFTGVLNYDENVFELVPYKEGEDSYIIKLNPDLNDYGIQVIYNQDTRIINTSLDSDRLVEIQNRMNGDTNSEINLLNNYLEIGTIQIKAKDNALAGDYSVEIDNIKGNNTEFVIYPENNYTKVHINDLKSKNTPEETNYEKDKANKEEFVYTKKSKKAILNIEVSSDGKKILITPDKENGATILSIKYNGEDVTKENGTFIFESEPNNAYEFYIYGIDGICLGNKYVTTIIKEGKPIDNETKENTKVDTEDNKDSNNNKQEGTDNNEKKSPQTGDYLYIVIGIMFIGIIVLFLVSLKIKNVKDPSRM